VENCQGRQVVASNRSGKARVTQSDLLRRSIHWVLNDRMFADLPRHGNTKWTPKSLVALAILSAWSDGHRLTDAFDKAKQLSQSLFGQVAIQTFQGMMWALVTWTAQLLPLMWWRLQALMEQVGGEHYRFGQWLPLAVDGSRFSTPRTKVMNEPFRLSILARARKPSRGVRQFIKTGIPKSPYPCYSSPPFVQ